VGRGDDLKDGRKVELDNLSTARDNTSQRLIHTVSSNKASGISAVWSFTQQKSAGHLI